MAAVEEGRAQSGFYCSTSGTFFETKEALQDHYKSDFHRYNLKRKVAGLPPVTREWFEARKAQLSASTATTGPVQRVWMDPLTKKKFNSDNTYQTFVRSKKYQDLVLASGQPAPAPIIFVPKEQSAAAEDDAQQTNRAAPAAGGADGKKPSYVVKAPSGMPWQHKQDDRQAEAEESANNAAGAADSQAASEEEEGNDSGWETASDVDEEEAAAAVAATASASKQHKQQGQRSNTTTNKAASASKRGDADADADGEMASDEGADEGEDGEEWEEWDVRASLFDGHVSRSLEENVAYMYRKYGFYFPDVEYLKDPEGLLKYLGAKLRYGGVPLYQSGNDGNAKRFRSLHGVQRHMVDTNQCRMLYDDNEEEYEDYYDYDSEGGEEEADGAGKALALAGADAAAAAGGSFELVVATSGAKGGTVLRTLGHREFARYYRQRHRPTDSRPSVVANTVLAQYRALALPSLDASAKVDQVQRRAQIKERRHQRTWLAQTLQTNFGPNGFKLPKNVPY